MSTQQTPPKTSVLPSKTVSQQTDTATVVADTASTETHSTDESSVSVSEPEEQPSLISAIKFLIINGANLTIRNNQQDTPIDTLKRHHKQEYEELMQWLSENHPEKALELMDSDNIQSKGVEL